jgi:hypothetical protein
MDGAAPGRHTAGLNTSIMREGVHLKLVASRRRRDAIKHSGMAAGNNGVRYRSSLSLPATLWVAGQSPQNYIANPGDWSPASSRSIPNCRSQSQIAA